MEDSDSAVVMQELIEFLTPSTRLDVRRTALDYVVGLSGAFDGSAGKLFIDNNFALGQALCNLCEATTSDRSQTLSALTNFTSGSAEAADFVLMKSRILQLAYDSCKMRASYATFAARLLANLSRHFPDRVQDKLQEHDAESLMLIMDLLCASSEDSFSSLLGYVLVNLSTLLRVRHLLVHNNFLPKIYPLSVQADHPEKREIAADILRNLAFEDSLHTSLLDESDSFLEALLVPLADAADELDEEETQKLPINMQYFEGVREKSSNIRQKLIEALYQLCATRHGRQYLRGKGVYALLRELDRATGDKNDHIASLPKMTNPVVPAEEEHTLHALIGVLIRYEDEMAIDPNVESLRQLE